MFGGQSHTRVRLRKLRQVGQCDKTLLCQGSNRKQLHNRTCNCCAIARTLPSQAFGHAFGPWRQWFLSRHANQGHPPARTCHVSGDCRHSPCSTLAMAPAHLACLRLSVKLFVQERNLRHGICLRVGDVVDQRFCLGAILGPEFRCAERC